MRYSITVPDPPARFRTFGGGPSFELDYRIVLNGGVTRTLHGIGRQDPARPGVYIGTVQDVTELRQVERQLRHERDYGASITSSMHEGFILTRDGAILEVNQALCQLTGYTRGELVGAGAPYPFWAPEAAEEISRQRALIDERGHEFETTYMRKDGTRFAASITSVTARATDGVLLGYVGVPPVSWTSDGCADWPAGEDVCRCQRHRRTRRSSAEAVRLLRSSGRSVPQLARELGCSPQSLRNWARQIDVDDGKAVGLTSEEREELRRLRRELRVVTEEREILKKVPLAAAAAASAG